MEDLPPPPSTLQNPEPAYRQIEQILRTAILNGELACGSRLPTVREFAEKYKTSIFTIQMALETLERDGLIERIRRRGTFVKGRSAKLRQVGIFFGSDFIGGAAGAFYQELYRRLSTALGERGVTHRLWVEGRSEDKHQEPLPELAEEVGRHNMQALIACAIRYEEILWLRQLGLPVAAMSSADVSFRVMNDYKQAISLAFQEFKRLGCRSIGAIFPFSLASHSPLEAGAPSVYRELFDSFTNHLVDGGFETQNPWVRTSERLLAIQEQEEYGYRQFRKIWEQPKRPDGILIWPDTVVRGSVAAMLEAGVSTPGDLKLVMHRNAGIPLLCPLAASWIVTDVARIADALIAQIDKQLSGETVEPVLVPPLLEASK